MLNAKLHIKSEITIKTKINFATTDNDVRQRCQTIIDKTPPRGWWLSAALELVFGWVEVEESLVETSFLLPVADYVFDAILLMGRSCEEILFVIQ